MFSEHPRVMYHHQVKSNYPLELFGRSKIKNSEQQGQRSQKLSSHSQKKHCSPKIDTQSRIFQLENQRVNTPTSQQQVTQFQSSSHNLKESSRKHFQNRIVQKSDKDSLIDILLAGRADSKQQQRGLSNGNKKNGETQAPDVKRMTKSHPYKSQNDFYSEIPNILQNQKLKYRTDNERVDNGKRSILKHHKDLKHQYDIFSTYRTQSSYDIMKFQQKNLGLKLFNNQSSQMFGSILGEYSCQNEKKQGKKMFSQQTEGNLNTQKENDRQLLRTSSSSFKNLFQSSIKLG